MAYCQATGDFDTCALLITSTRDTNQCSVEATYMVLDHIDGLDEVERLTAIDKLMRNLQPHEDCLGYDLGDDE